MSQIAGFQPFLILPGGIKYYTRDTEDGVDYLAVQDISAHLDHTADARSSGRGWTADKSIAPIASIPAIVQQKCMTEEGWDPLSPDPGCRKKLWQRLNGEWAHLRTSEWKLGVLRGIGA